MKQIMISKFGGPEVLEVQEVELPKISPNEVRIRVQKTSVNFADVKKRIGRKGNGTFPMTLGLDAAGIVDAVGELVSKVKVGERVIAFPKNGSYAEYVVANEELTYPIPDSISFSIAAACPTVSILSYKLLKDIARIQPGETVLVHAAAGGVGSTVVQLAKLLGASKVFGTVSHPKKFSTVKEAGADEVMLYDSFAGNVNALTSGVGVDIIFDSVAGEVSEKSFACLAKFGRLVQYGNASGEVAHFTNNQVHSSCRSILGFSLGTTRKERPEQLKEASREVFKYLSDGELEIKIGAEFPLEKVGKAHELLESRKSTGKILINVHP